jgi:hypothetical protein
MTEANIESELFSDELIEALCVSGLIESCDVKVSKWPHVVPYAEKYLVERRTNAFPRLAQIRNIAEQLAAADGDGQRYERYALQLLELAFTTGCSIVNTLFSNGEIWEMPFVQLFYNDLLTAAIYTNHVSLSKDLFETSHEEYGEAIFGFPHLAVVRTGNYRVLDMILAIDEKKPVTSRCTTDILIIATKNGDLQMTTYILESYQDLFWNYNRFGGYWGSLSVICQVLQTPNTEVFNMVLREIQDSDLDSSVEKMINRLKFFRILLMNAIESGWTDMTRHLLSLGTSIQGECRRDGEIRATGIISYACEFENTEVVEMLVEQGASVDDGAITVAAARGNSSILKKLLDSGADVDDWEARDCLYEAVKKGHIGTARMLLDAGADPNRGAIAPLVGAVESEHTAMFRLLVQKGANVARTLPEARNRAEAMGLESMLELLREYDVSGQ